MDINHTDFEKKKEEEKKPEEIVFKQENCTFDLPLRIENFSSDKELIRYIKNVETLVRRSSEYYYWTKYITEALGHTSCSLTNENMAECTIDIHHHPLNLYTICKSVIMAKIEKQKKFCTFDIALEIIELHFQDKVGYIPLLSSLHEKYHNGYLEIPIELVYGNYSYIIKNYTMEDCDMEKVIELSKITKDKSKYIWTKNSYPAIVSDSIELDNNVLTE